MFFAMADIARFKRKAEAEARLVSIPGDWFPPVPGTFVKETMNNLADLGEKMRTRPVGAAHRRSSKRGGPRTLTEIEPPPQRQELHANFQIRVERKQMAKNGKPNIPII